MKGVSSSDLKAVVIILMGVSGSGKTSIGRMLAKEFSLEFIDGDDHHPTANIEKMSQGFPLDDNDRLPWLDQLNKLAKEHLNKGCVIACSALKESYRQSLSLNIEEEVQFVYLKGSYDQIFKRMQDRKDHFMHSEMLKSQFETLEEPEGALEINISELPDMIVQKLKSKLKK